MLNRTVAIAVQAIFLAFSFQTRAARAQSASDNPGKTSAGTVIAPTVTMPNPGAVPWRPSSKQIREADDAYLEGAKQFAHKRFGAAQQSFEHAVQLNPNDRNYTLALLFTHETVATRLARKSTVTQQLGETTRANALPAESRSLGPLNPIVEQHFEQSSTPAMPSTPPKKPRASNLARPIEFDPYADEQSFHLYGDLRDIIRGVYNTFGIAVTFDPSIPTGSPIRFDVDHVNFYQATRILAKMEGIFDVPLQPTTALIAKDTKERRDALMPLVEETIYLPGQSEQQLLELANLARTMFDLNQVAVSNNSGSITLRGEQGALELINDTYTDLIDSRTDVLLDLTLYEIDSTNIKDIGFAPPTSATILDVSSAAQSLISSNQTLLNESIASGALKLTGSTYENELEEVEYLVAAGVSGSNEFTSLLGTIGNYQGVPLAGVSVGSATFNLLMSSTDVRTLDELQVRAGNAETATFRVGSRYPILTSLATASTSSTLATELAAAGVSSTLIAEYAGSTSATTVPQIQFEDLGITLKVRHRQ